MRFATNHINLTSEEFIKLEGNLFSTVIKLFYAFLWQVFMCRYIANTYIFINDDLVSLLLRRKP